MLHQMVSLCMHLHRMLIKKEDKGHEEEKETCCRAFSFSVSFLLFLLASGLGIFYLPAKLQL